MESHSCPVHPGRPVLPGASRLIEDLIYSFRGPLCIDYLNYRLALSMRVHMALTLLSPRLYRTFNPPAQNSKL